LRIIDRAQNTIPNKQSPIPNPQSPINKKIIINFKLILYLKNK